MTDDFIELNPEPVTPPPVNRFWGFWASAGFGAVVVIVYLVVIVFVMVVAAVAMALARYGTAITLDDFTGSINSNLGLLVAVSVIVSAFAGTGLILAFIKVRRGAGIIEYLGLKKISWKAALVAIAITAAFLILEALFSVYLQVGEGETNTMTDIYNTAVWPALLWIAIVVFAPFFEEPLIRGFLFEGFRRSRLGLIGAIFLTSIIWTCLHIGYSVYSLGAIFCFGLVLGAVRYKTGSLWSTVLMHAFNNAVAMALIALDIGG
jgi:membrane protease YdiL (CAAX protease family)